MENDQRIQPYDTDRVYQERPRFSVIWALVGILTGLKVFGKLNISWIVVLAPVWIPIAIIIWSIFALSGSNFH